eukprot:TRINITY_DN65409_c0_g1_i1.p1 TRINITY_DN65409_c0_g1~~TRINITY_DN65409_c0_g1_i1.p1  ORF type:complete len:480 (+),score=198.19 TRINITY_DN65409_c0_g1_i1:132-1571(+)
MFQRQKPAAPTAGHGAYPAAVMKRKPTAPAVSKPAEEPAVVNFNFYAAELPYDLKERRVVEHRIRTPHRRFSSADLTKVVAHWTDTAVGNVLWRAAEGSSVVVNSRSNGIMRVAPQIVTKAQKEKEATGSVNLRALIVPGLEEDTAKTVLKRITLIAAGEDGRVSLYGGRAPLSRCKDDNASTAVLTEMVKEQSGADLAPFSWVKVVEVKYAGSPDTVVYAPILRASPSPVFSPQVESGQDGQPDQYIVTPLRISLCALMEFRVSPTTPKDSLELCIAADALDEWAKRDMATQVLEILRTRGEESRIKTGLDKVKSERLGEKKRKRDAEMEERQVKRHARDTKMKREWEEEDEGKTDEEKRRAMLERQTLLKELRAQDAEEDSQGDSQAQEQDALAKERQTTQVVQQRQLEAFQYFDPLGSSSLPRLRLQNLLLCVSEELTQAEINSLLGLSHLPRSQDYIPYRKLCSDTVEVDAEMQG